MMKRTVHVSTAVFIMLLFSLWLFTASEGQSTQADEPTPEIWLIGDSLSRGLFATSPETAYRGLLQRWLAMPVQRLHGCTVAAALRSVDEAGNWPDVALIQVGIHNIGYDPDADPQICPQTPVEDFASEYSRLVSTLQSHGTVVIAGTIPWSGWSPTDPNWPAIRVLNEAINASGADWVADLWTATSYQQNQLSQTADPSFQPPYQGDSFHPGDAGHSRIAAVFLRAYRRATQRSLVFFPSVESQDTGVHPPPRQ